MKKIAGKKMLGPTLQEIELVPITDPIRLAAIDRRRKAVQKAMVAAAQKMIAGKKMRAPTLHIFDLVPITDPAELEAIDRRRKAAEKAMAADARNAGKRKSPKRK